MMWFGIAVGVWISVGVFTLIVLLRTWNDWPPVWLWPVIVLLWPLAWFS